MILEWYFLVSVLTGPFDPQTELGWTKVQRSAYSAPSYEACMILRDGVVQDIQERLKGGEGAVITSCQERRK